MKLDKSGHIFPYDRVRGDALEQKFSDKGYEFFVWDGDEANKVAAATAFGQFLAKLQNSMLSTSSKGRGFVKGMIPTRLNPYIGNVNKFSVEENLRNGGAHLLLRSKVAPLATTYFRLNGSVVDNAREQIAETMPGLIRPNARLAQIGAFLFDVNELVERRIDRFLLTGAVWQRLLLAAQKSSVETIFVDVVNENSGMLNQMNQIAKATREDFIRVIPDQFCANTQKPVTRFVFSNDFGTTLPGELRSPSASV